MRLEKPMTYFVDENETRTITNISNIRYVREDETLIDCDVVFKEFPLEVMPFTANRYDTAAHGREIYHDLKDGYFGPVGPYVPYVEEDEDGDQ